MEAKQLKTARQLLNEFDMAYSIDQVNELTSLRVLRLFLVQSCSRERAYGIYIFEPSEFYRDLIFEKLGYDAWDPGQ